MQTIHYTFPVSDSIMHFIKENDLLFDIETTGLDKKTTILYLIGCGYIRDKEAHIIQWFNDDAVSEKEILLTFSEFLRDFDGQIITYNGESFDIPYLNIHYGFHELSSPFSRSDDFISMDLYRLFKPFQHLFQMKHGKQKDWEGFVGINREDRYDGGQLIQVYKDYLIQKDSERKELVLLHNMEDIKGMFEIIPLLSYRQLLDGDFLVERLSELDQAISPLPMHGKKADFPLPAVRVHGLLNIEVPVPFQITSKVGAIWVESKHFLLDLPYLEADLKHFLKDYQNYYYLPGQDTAVHKSVGCFMSTKQKKKAKASTCYVRKTDIFFLFPRIQKKFGFHIDDQSYAKDFTLYRKLFADKTEYLSFDDAFQKNKKSTSLYVSDIIKYLFIEALN